MEVIGWWKKTQKEEFVEFAAIFANGQLFKGKSHLDALHRAIDTGAIEMDEDDKIKYYLEPGSDIHLDLFVTNLGRIIDRFQASQEFDVSASEYLTRQKQFVE